MLDAVLVLCAVVTTVVLLRMEIRAYRSVDLNKLNRVELQVHPQLYDLVGEILEYLDLANRNMRRQEEYLGQASKTEPSYGDELVTEMNPSREDLRRTLAEHREAGVLPDYLHEQLIERFGLGEEDDTTNG